MTEESRSEQTQGDATGGGVRPSESIGRAQRLYGKVLILASLVSAIVGVGTGVALEAFDAFDENPTTSSIELVAGEIRLEIDTELVESVEDINAMADIADDLLAALATGAGVGDAGTPAAFPADLRNLLCDDAARQQLIDAGRLTQERADELAVSYC